MTKSDVAGAFDRIVAGSRTVLEAVPEGKFGWRPHRKSWTLGELATHLTNLPNWAAATLDQSEFDVQGSDGGPPPLEPLASTSELLEALDASASRARATIEACSEEDLESPWTMLVAGEPRFTLPKRVVLRTFVLDHMIHHRAQLGVYLRLLDAPVPQLFGPTADDPRM